MTDFATTLRAHLGLAEPVPVAVADEAPIPFEETVLFAGAA